MPSGLTSNYSLPYPLSTDPVNVSGDIEQLATKIDNSLQEIIEDTSSLMWTTGGTFSNGLLAPTYNDTTGKMSMSLSQNLQTSASPTFAGLTTENLTVNGNVLSGTWNATEISANRGGTGLTSYAIGDIVYASASTTLTKLGIGSNNHVLTSNGSSPAWTANTGTGNVVRADSPALSGTPTAPTAIIGTNTTQIATTEFVQTAVSTLGGLPDQTGNAGKFLSTNGTVASWQTVDLSSKADINSPTFTGTPSAPTATADTNTTQIATTAFVIGQASNANPVALGSVAQGTSLRYARQDHVHPTTGLALLTGATFTGNVTVVSPTAAGSKGVREITMSTSGPSGGADGDVWIVYS